MEWYALAAWGCRWNKGSWVCSEVLLKFRATDRHDRALDSQPDRARDTESGCRYLLGTSLPSLQNSVASKMQAKC